MSLKLASRCHDQTWAETPARETAWTRLANQLGMPVLLATPACNLSDIDLPASPLDGEMLEQMIEIVGVDRVRTDFFERVVHARARNYPGMLALHTGVFTQLPDAVLYPQSGQDVQAVITFAARNGFVVVPWGGGTMGADCLQPRTLMVNLSRMSHVMANTDIFEAGLCGFEIRRSLQASGRRPVIPSHAFDGATLGGWIAGPRHRGTGVPQRWLRAATIATPQGLLDINDPDMCSLLVGSKGACGIITQACVLTRTLPEARETREFLFRDFESAARIMHMAAQEEAVEISASLSGQQELEFRRAFGNREQHWSERLNEIYRSARGFDAKAVTLSVTFQGMQRLVDRAVTRTEIGAANMGAQPLKNHILAPGPAPKDLRSVLLARGAAAEEFLVEISWEKLPQIQRALEASLETTLREKPPHPDCRGLVFSALSCPTAETVLLRLTLVFPRVLGSEAAQWDRILQALQAIAPEKKRNAHNNLHAVKSLIDPGNILPAIT